MPFADVCVYNDLFCKWECQPDQSHTCSIEMCYPSLHLTGNSSIFLFKSPAAMAILSPWTLLLQTIVHTMVGQPSHLHCFLCLRFPEDSSGACISTSLWYIFFCTLVGPPGLFLVSLSLALVDGQIFSSEAKTMAEGGPPGSEQADICHSDKVKAGLPIRALGRELPHCSLF